MEEIPPLRFTSGNGFFNSAFKNLSPDLCLNLSFMPSNSYFFIYPNVKNLRSNSRRKIEPLMILKIKHFVIFTTILFLTGCKQGPMVLSKIEAELLPIDSTLVKVDSIDTFVTPYRNRINAVLDSTLAYAPKMITKVDGEFNTSAGNLMADIIMSEANPIFKSRIGNEIDIVLLNHGGIRSIISKGTVSARTAYQVMPFENSIAVVELKGSAIIDVVEFLIKSGRAHPVSGIQITMEPSGKLKSIKIKGKPLDTKRNYYVATSDYLVSGGDNMVFFKDGQSITNLNYLIRNAMIDNFKKVDTISANVDNRFVKLK
jgi:2',3'-cyclic-nucleotide 2'-phosphodiesterase (5'-nucleotidase family)